MNETRLYLVRLQPDDPMPVIRVEAPSLPQAFSKAKELLPVKYHATAIIEESVDNEKPSR